MKKFSSLLFVLLLMLASFTAHAQEYPRGDVNQDGAINISDVTCLIDNLLLGVPEGDVNQDGVANISDVTSLIDYLLFGSWPEDPVTPPTEGDWVDLELPSGTLWATRNVGANSPEEYGDYFAWGVIDPGAVEWESYRWGVFDYSCLDYKYTKYCTDSRSGYNGFTDGKTDLEPEDDAAYMNWGSSWRMPTKEQLQELIDNCNWTWTQYNGIYGYMVTGTNGYSMFLPYSGYYFAVVPDPYSAVAEGYVPGDGPAGGYWSRSLNSEYCGDPYLLWLDYGMDEYQYFPKASVFNFWRIYSYPVRAVRV